jgi:uncharacterized iron-regulated protein
LRPFLCAAVVAVLVAVAVALPVAVPVATNAAEPSIPSDAAPEMCAPGRWVVSGAQKSHASLSDATSSFATLAFDDMARRSVVLLGENHASAEHHRWQLHTAAALFAHNANMVLGFEMFPRRVQPVLDAWVAGALTVEAFLERVDWQTVWGYPAELYLPLFHFARQHRIPMLALNVEREFVARVGREGWEAVPAADREGVSDPLPASDAYRSSLARVFAEKARHRGKPLTADPTAMPSTTEHTAVPSTAEHTAAASHEAEHAAILADPAFARFVAAQLTWDRAMAEAVAAAHRRPGAPLVVGIVGRGHLEHGWGIPHQLADLGIGDAAVLLPIDGTEACRAADPGIADAVFVLDAIAEPAPARPRLGVMIETAGDGGARIVRVVDDSVAAAAGLATGDVIRRAAGVDVADQQGLVAVIGRQAPGTWLPLDVERDGARLQIVARFPAHPDAAE